jgi:DsbC/DsbD-like thiol-disulfide interchange protein
MMQKISIPLALLFVGSYAGQARAQAPTPVHWSASVKGKHHSFRPGQKLEVALSAAIDSGWHLYALSEPPGAHVLPTQIHLADGQPFVLAGDIQSPEPISRMDPTVGAETQFYEDTAAFGLPVKIDKKARAGNQNLELDVTYQACSDRLCLPPRTQKVLAAVEIAGHHRTK